MSKKSALPSGSEANPLSSKLYDLSRISEKQLKGCTRCWISSQCHNCKELSERKGSQAEARRRARYSVTGQDKFSPSTREQARLSDDNRKNFACQLSQV